MSTTTSHETSPQKLHETVATSLAEVGAKDQRAHERARHQIKERLEHAQLKERKEKAATARATGLKPDRSGSRAGKKLTMESWDGDEPEAFPLPVSASPAAVVPAPRNTSGFPKIALADLMTFKTKKPSKTLDADFEVLPPVRSVIVLDDAGRDVEIDEAWEFISFAPESPAWKGLSYAQAAALAR